MGHKSNTFKKQYGDFEAKLLDPVTKQIIGKFEVEIKGTNIELEVKLYNKLIAQGAHVEVYINGALLKKMTAQYSGEKVKEYYQDPQLQGKVKIGDQVTIKADGQGSFQGVIQRD